MIEDWLTGDQSDLAPIDLDVLGAIYLLNKKKGYATLSAIRGRRGLSSTSLKAFLADLETRRNLVCLRRLEKNQYPLPYKPPMSYSLTKNAITMFLGSSPMSNAGDLHHAMEVEIFHEALKTKPPVLYLSIAQQPGQNRCDGILVERVDNKVFKWNEIVAVNIETPDEVRAHSSTTKGKEGQVFLNMITPFQHGAKELAVFCLKESEGKLQKLRKALPFPLSRRIYVSVVTVP